MAISSDIRYPASGIYDLMIIGAGPAGCTLALHVADSGLRVAIMDKATFPREKICGDALSGHVVNIIKRLPGKVWEDFKTLQPKTGSGGMRFVAPNGKFMDIPFEADADGEPSKAGFLCRRSVFDNFLVNKVKSCSNIDFFEDFTVEDIKEHPELLEIIGNKGTITGKMVAGADGNGSITGSTLSGWIPEKDNYFLGIRGYYKGVSDLHPQNFIELFFIRDILPGYLWIFQMEDGLVNVGLGMLHNRVIREKIILSQLLQKILSTDPGLSGRFKDANLTGKLEAHGLPMGPDPRPKSGKRFILLGDAAGLVDPFTGEGIGNAMMSGEIASKVVKDGFFKKDFSADFLSRYDHLLLEKTGREMRINKRMQRLACYPGLIDFIIGKVSNNKTLQSLMTKMYTDPAARKKLVNPVFYLELLFRK